MKYIMCFLLPALAVSNAFSQPGKIVFTTKEISSAAINSNYYYQFNAKDSAGNRIDYALQNLPAWLSYNKAENALYGKPSKTGQYAIRITATAHGDTARQYFMLTVCDRQTVNILCIGNSITNGTSVFNSYRRALWQTLHAGNYNVDFIGSWSKHHMGGEMPNPDFDLDHDGHSGWNAQDIFTPPSWDSTRGNLPAWLQTYTPHIVLMELGTNDVFQCRKTADVIKDLTNAIVLLRSKNNNVIIFAAQVPPLGVQWAGKKLCGDSVDYAARINELNKNIVTFAAVNNTSQSPVILVDQFSGIDPARDMFDDIHPNDTGEKLMAERWFNAIKPYIKKLR